MDEKGEYKILSLVARVLFAKPSSAAQIERDCSGSGQMISSQRTSLSKKNADKSVPLNRNQKFVDLEQSEEILPAEALRRTPPTITSEYNPPLGSSTKTWMKWLLTSFLLPQLTMEVTYS